MMLSETAHSNKSAITTNSISSFAAIGIGAKSLEREAYMAEEGAIMSFLSSTLCEYKAFATVLMLIIFQFSLYDFNGDEYLSSDAHGAVVESQHQYQNDNSIEGDHF